LQPKRHIGSIREWRCKIGGILSRPVWQLGGHGLGLPRYRQGGVKKRHLRVQRLQFGEQECVMRAADDNGIDFLRSYPGKKGRHRAGNIDFVATEFLLGEGRQSWGTEAVDCASIRKIVDEVLQIGAADRRWSGEQADMARLACRRGGFDRRYAAYEGDFGIGRTQRAQGDGAGSVAGDDDGVWFMCRNRPAK